MKPFVKISKLIKVVPDENLVCVLSHVQLSVAIVHQAPFSMESSRQTRVGCHFLLQEIFQTQGSNPCLLWLLHWQADSLPLPLPGKPGENLVRQIAQGNKNKGLSFPVPAIKYAIKDNLWISY